MEEITVAELRHVPAKNPGPTHLADRPRTGMRTYAETEELLREMKSDR